MNHNIEILNRRIGDALGRPDGTHPRFAWQFAPDISYYFRARGASGFQRRSWGERLGKVWVLCHWRLPMEDNPPMTPEDWRAAFGGQFPYPRNGEYRAYAETALPSGMVPNDEATAFYIASLRAQLAQSERAAVDNEAGRTDAVSEQSEQQARKQVDDAIANFEEMVGDWEPSSWKLGEPHMPGDQDGPVSFGGM